MRSVEEWIGKTDDTLIPDRVKLRVFKKFDGRCAVCTNEIKGRLAPPQYDHIVALINEGENRESNLQLLCTPDHKVKTAADVAEKSAVYGSRLKALGIKKRKGKPMPGSRASGWKRKIGGGVERR